MSDDLHIALLGSLIVTRGGLALPDTAWRSRQERRLLGILLAARGARVPMDRLVEWLWPDAAQDVAAVTLRSTVSSLRRTLEPESAIRASSQYILTRPGGYAWNAESGAASDVDEFLAHLQAADDDRVGPARRPADEGSEPAGERRARHLSQAIALYRGDYLEDESGAAWATALREFLRERFLNALQDLAELRLAADQHGAAIELAWRGLEYDRLREPLYRVLMRAQALAGDVAGALQCYERYRRMLDEELGAVPSTQTQKLHTAILRGEVTAEAGRQGDKETPYGGVAGRQGLPRVGTRGDKETQSPVHPFTRSPLHPFTLSSQDPRPAAPPGRSAAAPFVGRVQELAALNGWIDELAQRRGGVVAIVGEAGIGKTRLAEEAMRVAAAKGARSIVLRCSVLERGLPFAPLSEALRPLLRAAPEAVLDRLPPAALAQVADLLPLLRERLPDLPALPAAPPPESRNRLLDGLVDLALAMARDGPLVVFCDDGQWADEATLAVLGRLARHTPRRALLLLLAYRSEELAENGALHELLRTLGRSMLLRPLVLGRFDTGEVAEFLAGLAQVQPGRLARLAPRLAAPSGGNPLFLSVAVQALLEARGAPTLAALLPDLDSEIALPDLAGAPQIRALVLALLERLPPPARALLEQIAVIGRPVSLDLLEQLAGTPALEAAQTLLERQLLFEDADGRLAFGHDLVRSIVAATLSSPRRRQLHRQAAEAIAALHDDQPEHAAELAFHFGQTGYGAEAAVLRYATAAGDQARRSYGYRAALDHYDAALRAAERLGLRAPAVEVRRAFAGRLHAAEAMLDWDGIMATAARYDRWTARCQPHAPPLVTTRRLVLLRALMGDLAGAAAISAEQARQQPEAAPAVHDLLRRMAIILQPIEPPGRPGDTETRRYGDRGQGSGVRGREATTPLPPPAGGGTEGGRAWPSAALSPQPSVLSPERFPFRRADPPPGAPADDLPALLGPDEAALALFLVGWAALMQGLLHDAEPCLLRAYELAGETSQAAVAVIAALQLAHLNALRGERGTTAAWLRLSLDLAQQAPEAAWASIWPRIHQAFLLLLDDQHTAAREHFEQMAAQLQELPAFQSHRASVEAGLGLLALARGDAQQAAARLSRALASPQLLYGFVYVAAQHGTARIAALQGDLAYARLTLAGALDYSARRGLLPEYVRTAIEVARVERDFGEPGTALPLLRAAAGLASEAGLDPLATAASALLARLAS